MAKLSPGSKVRLDISRRGKAVELTATLAERPSALSKQEPSSQEPEQTLGLEVQDLTQDLAEQLHLTAGEGVIVAAVAPDSPAAEKEIQSAGCDPVRQWPQRLVRGGIHRRSQAIAEERQSAPAGQAGRHVAIRDRQHGMTDRTATFTQWDTAGQGSSAVSLP